MGKFGKAGLRGFRSAPKTSHKKVVEDYTKDMKDSKEMAQLKAQDTEFKTYLENKVATTPEQYVKFFRDMLTKLNEGVILTEGMVSAIRKCKDRDQKFEKAKNEPKQERTIILKIKPWLMKDLGLDSRVIKGVVKAETSKAYLIEGHADMVHNACWCMRCGKELTEPASQVTGFGAICAEKMEIPYKAELLQAPASVRKAVRMQFIEKLHNQKFERWIPKSQVAEIMPEDTKLEEVKVHSKPNKTAKDTKKSPVKK